MKFDIASRDVARKLLVEYNQLEKAKIHFERHGFKMTVTFTSMLFRDVSTATSCDFPLNEKEKEYIKEYIDRRMKEIERILKQL